MNEDEQQSLQINQQYKNQNQRIIGLHQKLIQQLDDCKNKYQNTQNGIINFKTDNSDKRQQECINNFGNNLLNKKAECNLTKVQVNESEQRQYYANKQNNCSDNLHGLINSNSFFSYNYKENVPSKPIFLLQDIQDVIIKNENDENAQKVLDYSNIQGFNNYAQNNIEDDLSNDQLKQNQFSALTYKNQDQQQQFRQNDERQEVINDELKLIKNMSEQNISHIKPLNHNSDIQQKLQNDKQQNQLLILSKDSEVKRFISPYRVVSTRYYFPKYKTDRLKRILSKSNSNNQKESSNIPDKNLSHILFNKNPDHYSFLNNLSPLSTHQISPMSKNNNNNNNKIVINNNIILNHKNPDIIYESNQNQQFDDVYKSELQNTNKIQKTPEKKKDNHFIIKESLKIKNNINCLQRNDKTALIQNNTNQDEKHNYINNKIIIENVKENEEILNEQQNNNLKFQDKIIDQQQIPIFLNQKIQQSLKKQQILNNQQRKSKSSLYIQQENSLNEIQNYINSQNTKEAIMDYFKSTNEQREKQLPTFEQYLNNFKTQYYKNNKKKIKNNNQRKSYDIVMQSKGYPLNFLKEDVQDQNREQSIHITPLSSTNKENQIMKIYKGSICKNDQNAEQLNRKNIQLQQQYHYSPLSYQQKQQRTPIEIQCEIDFELKNQYDSLLLKSNQNKLQYSTKNSQKKESSNVAKQSNDQSSQNTFIKKHQPYNRTKRCFTEFSDSEISNINLTQNHFFNKRILENISKIDSQLDNKYTDYTDQSQEYEMELSSKNKKGRLRYNSSDKIEMDLSLQNSLSNYLSKKVPIQKNNKIKNISHQFISELQNNLIESNFEKKYPEELQNNQDTQTKYYDNKDNCYVQKTNEDNIVSKQSIKNQIKQRNMIVTYGTSMIPNRTKKQPFISRIKPRTPSLNIKENTVDNIQQNNFVEIIDNSIHNKQRTRLQSSHTIIKISDNLSDLKNIDSNKIISQSTKSNNNIKYIVNNIQFDQQNETCNNLKKNKSQLQMRREKTPNKINQIQNDNVIRIYKNQNSPQNLKRNTHDSSYDLFEYLKCQTSNKSLNVSLSHIDIDKSFQIQRDLEQQYLNQYFQSNILQNKLRTQSEGRKRFHYQNDKIQLQEQFC